MRLFQLVGIALVVFVIAPHAEAQPAAGHDFIAEARELLVLGACANGEKPDVKGAVHIAHCKKVHAAQEAYRNNWLVAARPFFATNVPAGIPKVVVYPFAGGDLATALAVYPDADEITTLSLEPAGAPRAHHGLDPKTMKSSLATIATELSSLYRSNFSVTMNMIGAMRGGKLPTQLIFGLSALWIHGYEPVSLRYFQLTAKGDVRYLTRDEVTAAEAITDIGKRNRELANIELQFRKQGKTRVQVYRHIMANLDDAHLAENPAPLLHLQSKGKVTGMTKAASYLLSFGTFATMRKYVIDHVQWMVSDSTGLPPAYGTPAGFEYETHGTFVSSNMKAGGGVAPAWRAMFAAQPKRPLAFRFGYPDGKFRGHLVIMRKPVTPSR